MFIQTSVMAGLDPAIHAIGPRAFGSKSGSSGSAWMAGSRPAMTKNRVNPLKKLGRNLALIATMTKQTPPPHR
jgi:hypothetical protein